MKREMIEFVQEFTQYCQSMAHQKLGVLSTELNLPLHRENVNIRLLFSQDFGFLKKAFGKVVATSLALNVVTRK